MIALAGADLVLPDRVVPAATLVIDDGRILEVRPDHRASASTVDLSGHTIVPGFIDVHVHGVAGTDSLDQGNAIERIATALPRFGVVAFCPTTVACRPDELERVLAQVNALRLSPPPAAARVLPAHLESNFIEPAFHGAQPLACLRTPEQAVGHIGGGETSSFTAADVRQVLQKRATDIAIVTLAPELVGGLELVRWLVDLGIRASAGHSGASYDQGLAAFAAGVSQATHLCNAMPIMHHRRPGLVGAVLQDASVTAEVVCDGVHVHPALVRTVVAVKGPSRVMAISDGTAAAALPAGAHARLGGRRITRTHTCAVLDDGTMAGSVLTLDAAFRELTTRMGFSLVEAALMCATTPARTLGLERHGVIDEGAVADLAVLDADRTVVQTYIGGRCVYERNHLEGNSPAVPFV